jgi:phosphatidylglycerophosphate synthase
LEEHAVPEDVARHGSAEPVLKRVDAWWTVLVVDPLAVRLVGLLRRFDGITPTAVTVVAHLLGFVTAAMFVTGWLVPGALLFELRFVLDCADGKLARVQGTSSAAGAYLDYVGDYVVVAANVVGLALYLGWEDRIPMAIAVGLPAAFLAHIAAGQARAAEATSTGGGDVPPKERLPEGYRAWMAERRMRPLPSRIEAEHALLFATPLLAGALDVWGPLIVVVWFSTAYFAYRALRITAGGYRIAAQRDRTP